MLARWQPGEKAKEATGIKRLHVLADRGYLNGEEILKCEQADMMPLVPKPLTSNAKADGRFEGIEASPNLKIALARNFNDGGY